MKMKDFWRSAWRHPLCVAAYNVFIVLFLYTLCRIFYYTVNRDLYGEISFTHLLEMLRGGVRFDITAIFYLNSAYMVLQLLPFHFRENATYQRVVKWFYFVPNVLGLFVNLVDVIYTRFTDRRTNFHFFEEFENDGNLGGILWDSVWQYWYVTLFAVGVFLLLFYAYRPLRSTSSVLPPWAYYVVSTVILCTSIYFVVIGIRGGFGAWTRPINISNASQYANTPQETNIVLNTPFCMMMTIEHDTYKSPNYFPSEELETIMSPERAAVVDSASHKGMNVVIFILESFAKEYVGFFNRDLDDSTYVGFTPFLDELLEKSVSFRYSFASGRKSIDAMPSILGSIPMLINSYITTSYATNEIHALASCLREEAYYTAFFHGAPNGSMGFQAFARNAGFEDYFGMDEFGDSKAFDGRWAIWDEEFLQFMARTMEHFREPFLSTVFTASSHHPFKVPSRYEGVFPLGDKPLHQCIGYSDNALRLFFEHAKTQPWYNNTLFVFTADHSTSMLTHPEYVNAKGLYDIPIFFFTPNGVLPAEMREQVISQTDIMPSVLNFLGYGKPYFAFGEDALGNRKTHPYAVCYNTPSFQIMSDRLLILFDGKEITHIYDFQQDPCLKNNDLTLTQTTEAQQMLHYLKAYIQQYIDRMNANKLIVAPE